MVIQRQTQSAQYWSEGFSVSDADLQYLYNLLLDDETPLTSDELAQALIRHRIAQEDKMLERQLYRGGTAYMPKDAYPVGQDLIFPQFQYAAGKVIAVRKGQNPAFGDFDVITVDFGEGKPQRSFAARLAAHILNDTNGRLPDQNGDAPSRGADDLATDYAKLVAPKLEASFTSRGDIVRIAARWFPRALLADINEGHLNLAEAVLDMAGGGPLPTSQLVPHLDLTKTINEKLVTFSLDYALQEDPRFDEVGPAGQVQWYLHRLEPQEVQSTPLWLVYQHDPVGVELLPDLKALEEALEDEFGLPHTVDQTIGEVTLTLTYPHWRAGTLPLSQKLSTLFPTAYESPRIRFTLVDGHSGEKVPGWVVRQGRYVYGLAPWYKKYEMLVGGYVTIRRGHVAGEVIIEIAKRRPGREWVRSAVVNGGHVSFSMQKQQVAVEYDEQAIISVESQAALDELWQKPAERRALLAKVIVEIFRELAKLTLQSAVHSRSLYSGINIVRRTPPAVIFTELMSRPYFVHVGDGYWRLDDSKLSE